LSGDAPALPSHREGSDEHAKAYFEAALSYRAAAYQLFATIEAKPTERQLPIRDPTYFLYAHAVELALKACLLSHDHPIEHGHAISDYYEKCRTAKLIGIKDPRHEMHNLIALLEAGNELPLHRYRYPGKFTKIKLKKIGLNHPDNVGQVQT
jgi:hypothetical protein